MVAKTYKPVFVGWIALAAQAPIQLFFTLWVGGFFGGMFGKTPESYAICGLVGFVLVPLICYYGKKLNYDNTEYVITPDSIEMKEGFFTVQNKSVNLCEVTEVSIRKGILQRQCNLGSVYLATKATGAHNNSPYNSLGFSSVSGSGITIRDIENADELYGELRSAVQASKQA